MVIRSSSLGGIPFGNNSGRPSSPNTGQPYFNGEAAGQSAAGGSGVGGTGYSTLNGGNAVANTGSGGGGSTNKDPNNGGVGGNGSAGVVVIAYPNTLPALSNIPGTLTYDQPTRSGYIVYRFTAGSGTITF